MQLNCKVKKSGNPLISIWPSPPFQGYPVFLAKFLVPPPHVAQVLEEPTPYPLPLPFNKGGGGSNYMTLCPSRPYDLVG